MAGGGFFGGVYDGAMGVQDLILRQEESERRQKLSEQADYEFNKKKELADSMQSISGEQAGAEAAQSGAQQSYDDAISGNAAGVAANNPAAVNEDGTLATQTQALTEPQKVAVAKAYGIRAPVAVQYDYNQKRIAALQKSGDWMGAQKLRQETQASLAGSVISAYAAGDERATADLYNKFPNGHSVGSLHIAKADKDGHESAKAGDLIITDANADGSNGQPKVINQWRFMQGVAAQMDPKEALSLMNSKMALDARMAYENQSIASREKIAADNIEARVAAALLRGGSVAGRPSSGGSKSGSVESGINGVPGIKDQKEWAEWVTAHTAGKDGSPPAISGPDGKAVQLDPVTYRNEFSGIASGIANANKGLTADNIAAVTQKIAQAKYLPNPAIKIAPVLDPNTGEIRTTANVDNMDYVLDKQPLNEAQARAAWKASGMSDGDINTAILQSNHVKSARIGGAFAELEGRDNAGKKAQAIRSNFGGSEDAYNAARDLAFATANEYKQKWMSQTRQTAQDERLNGRSGKSAVSAAPARQTSPVQVGGVTVMPRVKDRLIAGVGGLVNGVKDAAARAMNRQRADIISSILHDYRQTGQLSPTNADNLNAVFKADPSLERSVPPEIVAAVKFSTK